MNGTLAANSLPKTFEDVERLQQIGNDMRMHDHAAVARAFVRRIREIRARKTGQDPDEDGPVDPDGKPRAYILDSIRHPAEVELLTRLYQDAFVLIGVVCEEHTRRHRLQNEKFKDASRTAIEQLMKRDAKEGPKHGQRVSDAFHLAHYFLDNTEDRELDGGRANPAWDLAEQLTRLKKILTHSAVVRPLVSETAMFAAHGAGARSACLSRQVGASIVDEKGEFIALGTNEVPQAGGGVYGSSELDPQLDGRCVYRQEKFCSNTREQNEIVAKVIESLRGAVKDARRNPAFLAAPLAEILQADPRPHRALVLLDDPKTVDLSMEVLPSRLETSPRWEVRRLARA